MLCIPPSHEAPSRLSTKYVRTGVKDREYGGASSKIRRRRCWPCARGSLFCSIRRFLGCVFPPNNQANLAPCRIACKCCTPRPEQLEHRSRPLHVEEVKTCRAESRHMPFQDGNTFHGVRSSLVFLYISYLEVLLFHASRLNIPANPPYPRVSTPCIHGATAQPSPGVEPHYGVPPVPDRHHQVIARLPRLVRTCVTDPKRHFGYCLELTCAASSIGIIL